MDSGDGWKNCTDSDGTADSVAGAGVTFEGCAGLEGAWVSLICSEGDWVIGVWAVGAWESGVWAE
jgi:hypothetical protein